MGYKLGYHILVLLNQALLTNSVLTNEVLLYIVGACADDTKRLAMHLLNLDSLHMVPSQQLIKEFSPHVPVHVHSCIA